MSRFKPGHMSFCWWYRIHLGSVVGRWCCAYAIHLLWCDAVSFLIMIVVYPLVFPIFRFKPRHTSFRGWYRIHLGSVVGGWCCAYAIHLCWRDAVSLLFSCGEYRQNITFKFFNVQLLIRIRHHPWLRFPPGSPVSSCFQNWDVFDQSKTPPHPGGMGSCCVKKWMSQCKC